MEEMGMTNEQYKGMLLDELEDWQEVRELALETNNEKILKKADQQIAKINEKIIFYILGHQGEGGPAATPPTFLI